VVLLPAVTTIGYGDVVPTSTISRIATVVLSLFSIFYIAVITGAVVSVCSEMMRMRRDTSIAAFQHKLEHLEDLSHEELAELSAKNRALR
jgi:voltage-gated potassium channel